MIVILKQNAEQNEVNALLKQLEDMGFDHHYSKGENSAIVGIIGDTSTLDTDDLKTIDVVADVKRVSPAAFRKLRREMRFRAVQACKPQVPPG